MRWARRAAGRGRPRIWLGLGLALLNGCAVNPKFDLAATAEDAGPRRLESVPFFPQTDYQCGPAALAGVLGASGVRAAPEALAPQVYLPKRRGSLQVELLAATRRAGRVPYVLAGDPEDLIAQVEAGRPVLVLQNLGTPHFPRWHYAVLVGFDPGGNRVYLNSGRRSGLRQESGKFLRTWNWGGRWAMVALRPGVLPARAEPLRYAEAVAAFEAVAGAEAAERAWRAARKRWPDDARPHLALGNLAYAAGRHHTALSHYANGLTVKPGDPVLANNLASVLGTIGCPRAGEAVLAAVAVGLPGDSPWRSAIAATKAELAAQPGGDPERCAAAAGGD